MQREFIECNKYECTLVIEIIDVSDPQISESYLV